MSDLTKFAYENAERAARARRATAAFRQLGRAFKLGNELDRLRSKAERFDTPAWQRPYWRLRARRVVGQIRENAATREP